VTSLVGFNNQAIHICTGLYSECLTGRTGTRNRAVTKSLWSHVVALKSAQLSDSLFHEMAAGMLT